MCGYFLFKTSWDKVFTSHGTLCDNVIIVILLLRSSAFKIYWFMSKYNAAQNLILKVLRKSHLVSLSCIVADGVIIMCSLYNN